MLGLIAAIIIIAAMLWIAGSVYDDCRRAGHGFLSCIPLATKTL